MPPIIRPVVLGGSVKTTPAEVFDPDGGYWPRDYLVPRPDAIRLRPFAVQYVANANPQTPNQALMYLVPAYRFTYWLDCEGYSKEPSKAFVRDRIEEFHSCGMGKASADSRRTWRSLLRALGPANAPQAWGATPKRLKHSDPEPPYTDQEEDGYFGCVPHQATPGRAHILSCELNLGFGAGLMPNDFLHVRREHVITTSDGLTLIRVPDGAARPRTIPVLARYAPAIRQMADECPPDRPLFGSLNPLAKDPVTALMSRVEIPSRLPALTIQRLRRTYIVSLLNANVRVSELLAFTGLTSLTTVQVLLPYVQPRMDDANTAYWEAVRARL